MSIFLLVVVFDETIKRRWNSVFFGNKKRNTKVERPGDEFEMDWTYQSSITTFNNVVVS